MVRFDAAVVAMQDSKLAMEEAEARGKTASRALKEAEAEAAEAEAAVEAARADENGEDISLHTPLHNKPCLRLRFLASRCCSQPMGKGADGVPDGFFPMEYSVTSIAVLITTIGVRICLAGVPTVEQVEAHRAAEEKVQAAMKEVVECETTKASARTTKDRENSGLIAAVQSRAKRTKKHRLEAEKFWGSAVSDLQVWFASPAVSP